MAKRPELRKKSEEPPERTALSPERLQLIHRFMTEKPEGEEDVVAFAPAPRAAEPRPSAPNPPPAPRAVEPPPSAPDRSRAPSLSPVPRLAPTVRMPRLGDMAPRPVGARGLHVTVRSMRSRAELAWPLAAVILSLLVGMLIAHSV